MPPLHIHAQSHMPPPKSIELAHTNESQAVGTVILHRSNVINNLAIGTTSRGNEQQPNEALQVQDNDAAFLSDKDAEANEDDDPLQLRRDAELARDLLALQARLDGTSAEFDGFGQVRGAADTK